MNLKDCGWCGMPIELVTTWTERRTLVDADGAPLAETLERDMATARCLEGHWYGGAIADLEAR